MWKSHRITHPINPAASTCPIIAINHGLEIAGMLRTIFIIVMSSEILSQMNLFLLADGPPAPPLIEEPVEDFAPPPPPLPNGDFGKYQTTTLNLIGTLWSDP